MSCLARSSQPNHISRLQRPDTSPTTLLNSRVSFRRSPSLGPVALFLSILKLCLDTAQSHANVLLRLTCQRLLLQIQVKVTNYNAAHLLLSTESRKRVCRACCRSWYVRSYSKSQQSHSLDRSSFDSNSLFARCDHFYDALQVQRNVRTAHAPAPQRLVRSWRHGSRCVSCGLIYVSASVWSIVRQLAQSMQTLFLPVEGIGWQWMG